MKNRCYNCKHASEPFKIKYETHMHCEHPDRLNKVKKRFLSIWETTVKAKNTCKDHELKQNN